MGGERGGGGGRRERLPQIHDRQTLRMGQFKSRKSYFLDPWSRTRAESDIPKSLLLTFPTETFSSLIGLKSVAEAIRRGRY